MLIFKSLSYRNFLSAGNAPIEIELNKTKNTQIVGMSGHGKSSICDAICFGLFGKPFRNINKNQLINSINGKHCQVDIEFSNDGKDYKVVRGMKPNKFEIWTNGVLINQEASSRDYQKILEQQILKLNYKVFCQSVILGSASFIPFMQLSAAQRREVIEDILDIKIFSSMNTILKTKIQETKDHMNRLDESISVHKTKVESQKKLIKTLTNIKENSIEKNDQKILELEKQIDDTYKINQSLYMEIDELRKNHPDKTEDLTKELKKASKLESKIQYEINDLSKKLKFLSETNECPSCLQTIEQSHKESQFTIINKAMEESREKFMLIDKVIDKITYELNEIEEINKTIHDKHKIIQQHQQTIQYLSQQIKILQNENQVVLNDTSNIDGEKDLLKEYAANIVSSLEEKNDLFKSKQIHDITAMLLKDTGIKTTIIREYLPVMNYLINKYLQALDLFIQFELDESFSEKIKSRHRDEFSYASFSEGEKARINIALLFTWREIARMKNSVNTNLLIMDEVLDNSLDENSLENFMTLIQSLRDDVNLFIISHRNTHSERFDGIIHIKKQNGFSIID